MSDKDNLKKVPSKLCQKRDGSIVDMDRIWVCCNCGKTFAGDKAYHLYDIYGNEKWECIPCGRKGIAEFIGQMRGLENIVKKD